LPSVFGAIPARYGSVRLPGKALLPVAGIPLIERVYRQVEQVDSLARLVVLTDDERISNLVKTFGGHCELTPADCASGTDRVAWAARNWDASAIVNVQGDEPLVDVGDLTAVVDHLTNSPGDPIVTLATECPEDLIDDPNAVKVVTDRDGYALYFSRSPIPFRRHGSAPCLLHVGVYGYQRHALLELAELEPSPLEKSESLEQLRALENGYAIRVLPAARPSIGIDTEEDLQRVERLIREQDGSRN
jgi:3-deoxy-manno-octulosonate cytidylyltransferase (CMP-KDO synthetase)